MRLGNPNLIHAGAFVALVVLIFTSIALHEPWRDEAQAYLLVADSTGWTDLWHRMRLEGHPILWFGLLRIIGYFGPIETLAPYVHGLIASGTIALILFRSPFRYWQRIAFSAGYFTVYEYAAISRNYALGFFLILLAVDLWKHRRQLPALVTLILAAQCNVFATLIAVAVLFSFTIRLATTQSRVSGLLLIAGILGLVAAQVIPPADAGFAPGWHWSTERLSTALSRLGQVYLPVPGDAAFQSTPWNSSFLSQRALLISGMFITIFMAVVVLKSRIHRLLFLMVVLGIVLFGAIKLGGFPRHYGHIWIAFAAFWWMDYRPQSNLSAASAGLGFLLLIHVWAAGVALTRDYTRPFSEAGLVADVIRELKAENRTASYPDNYGTAVSLKLQTPLYLPIWDTTMTHIIWNDRINRPVAPVALRRRLDTYFTDYPEYFIVSPYWLPDIHSTAFSDAENIHHAGEALSDEALHVFRITRQE